MVHGESGELVELGGQLPGRLRRGQTEDGVEPGALVAGLPMYDSVARLREFLQDLLYVILLSFLRGRMELRLLPCCPKPGLEC